MEKILVAKSSTKYASSKASTTEETAFTPDLLAVGAIGIYGMYDFGGTVGFKTALITNTAATASSTPGQYTILKSDFNGDTFFIHVGTAEGSISSSPITGKSVTLFLGSEHEDAVNQISYIGYDGTTGSLNTPTTLEVGHDFLLGTQRFLQGAISTEKKTYSAPVIAATTIYSATRALINNINGSFDVPVNSPANLIAEMITDGTRTVFVNNVTATKGSDLITVTAHALPVGTIIKILGVTYTVIAVVDANTLQIDSLYTGSTATTVKTNALTGSYTALTKYGIKLTTVNILDSFTFNVADQLQYATINYSVGAFPGNGTSAQVSAVEKNMYNDLGFWDSTSLTVKQPVYYTVAGTAYDLYTITDATRRPSKDGINDTFTKLETIQVAFPDGAFNAASDNQGAFEGIMTAFKTSGVLSLFSGGIAAA